MDPMVSVHGHPKQRVVDDGWKPVGWSGGIFRREGRIVAMSVQVDISDAEHGAAVSAEAQDMRRHRSFPGVIAIVLLRNKIYHRLRFDDVPDREAMTVDG